MVTVRISVIDKSSRDDQAEHGIFRAVKLTRCDTTIVDPGHYTFAKPTEYVTTRVNSNVMMDSLTVTCQCKFIDNKKYVTADVDNRVGCVCQVGTRAEGEVSVLPTQHCHEPKYALKNKI